MNLDTMESWWKWVPAAVDAAEVIAMTLPILGLMMAACLLAFPRLRRVRVGKRPDAVRRGNNRLPASHCQPGGVVLHGQTPASQPV